MSNINTRDKGIQATKRILKQLGVSNISEYKEKNKKFITFTSATGKEFQITTRSKTSGTWQTTIDYGKETKENTNEKDYWIFVDLSKQPNEFYIVPLWWIKNDIYKTHKDYLRDNGGTRPNNPNSKHHGIPLKRIRQWHNKWELIN